jgi:broad specificity phosphatase PhoE
MHRAIIIRHCQSQNTANWRWNRDHPDDLKHMVPAKHDGLSTDGRIQAATILNHLPKEVNVHCADSARAKETALIISGHIHIDLALNELAKYDYTDEHKDANSEEERVDQWIKSIRNPSPNGHPVVYITHAGIMAKGLRKLLGMKAVFGPAVGSISVIDFVGDEIIIHCLGSRIPGTNYWHNEDAIKKLK